MQSIRPLPDVSAAVCALMMRRRVDALLSLCEHTDREIHTLSLWHVRFDVYRSGVC
jgi:hypothetical protein